MNIKSIFYLPLLFVLATSSNIFAAEAGFEYDAQGREQRGGSAKPEREYWNEKEYPNILKAIRQGDIKKLKELIEDLKNVNIQDSYSREIPLMLASLFLMRSNALDLKRIKLYSDMVMELLKADADVGKFAKLGYGFCEINPRVYAVFDEFRHQTNPSDFPRSRD